MTLIDLQVHFSYFWVKLSVTYFSGLYEKAHAITKDDAMVLRLIQLYGLLRMRSFSAFSMCEVYSIAICRVFARR